MPTKGVGRKLGTTVGELFIDLNYKKPASSSDEYKIGGKD